MTSNFEKITDNYYDNWYEILEKHIDNKKCDILSKLFVNNTCSYYELEEELNGILFEEIFVHIDMDNCNTLEEIEKVIDGFKIEYGSFYKNIMFNDNTIIYKEIHNADISHIVEKYVAMSIQIQKDKLYELQSWVNTVL